MHCWPRVPQTRSSQIQYAVGSKQKAVGVASSKWPIHHLQFLSFQQHSRFQRLTTYVFIDIPALPSLFPQRSFVFNNILALVGQFLKLVAFSFPISADILT
jgi:hypothetical protein